MASADEIARDIVVAWLSHNSVPFDTNNPTKTGQTIGTIYKAVLAAVQGGTLQAAGVSPESETAADRRRELPR
jgi:uncharacterized membrane protein (DUF441 family)